MYNPVCDFSTAEVSEKKVEHLLIDLINEAADDAEASDIQVNSFSDTGMMTSDKGVLLRLGKHKFQITIVQC